MPIVQNKTRNVYVYAVLKSDHVTAATGKTLTVTVGKDGAALGALNGTVSEVADGLYKVALSTTDTNTVGDLCIRATESTVDDIVAIREVVSRPDAVAGLVSDGSPGASSFITNLTEATDDAWNGTYLTWISGSMTGQMSRVNDYAGSTKRITVEGFSASPANGDKFVLINS